MNFEVTPDLINGLFQVVGAIIQWGNVVRIRKHQSVKGFDPKSIAFFSIYGVWCLYFFQGLDQWLSFIGGVMIVAVNLLWLAHVFYYWRKSRRRQKLIEKHSRKAMRDMHGRYPDVLEVPVVHATEEEISKIFDKPSKD